MLPRRGSALAGSRAALTWAAYCPSCSAPPWSMIWKEGSTRANRLCLRGEFGRAGARGRRCGVGRGGGGLMCVGTAGAVRGTALHTGLPQNHGSRSWTRPGLQVETLTHCTCMKLQRRQRHTPLALPGCLTCTCPGRKRRRRHRTAGCAAPRGPGHGGGGEEGGGEEGGGPGGRSAGRAGLAPLQGQARFETSSQQDDRHARQ